MMTHYRPLLLLGLCWAGSALAQSITLEQAMADPDWIGREPQQPYWADDGDAVYYWQKREGSQLLDLYRQELDDSEARQVPAAEFVRVDVAGGSLSPNSRLKTYAREGDIYVKNLRDGSIRQLTRTVAEERAPYFNADSNRVVFSRGEELFVRDLESGLEYQPAEILLEDPPADPEPTYLESQQLRLFDIIRLQQEREDQEEAFANRNRQADADRVQLPYYLGEETEVLSRSLSPAEDWLLLTTRDKSEQEAGREDSMPNYVTASGYVENREVRNLVGTTDFADQQLYLFDLENHRFAALDLTGLPGRERDPLAEQLPQEASDDEDDEEEHRDIYINGVRWSADGSRVLFNAISRDNKDRWLISINTGDLDLQERESDGEEDAEDKVLDQNLMKPIPLHDPRVELVHHLHDPAWINRDFTDADWLPDNETLYFTSEADGYGHLYVHDRRNRQLTRGNFQVREPVLTRDGEHIYFRGNVEHPTFYEIYRVDLADGDLERMTELGGMTEFRLAPDESRLLLIHSKALQPPELYLQNARPGARTTRLTHTVSAELEAIDWAQPEYVEVPSSHIDRVIHSRVYTPDNSDIGSRPAVVFIHGAGYLQNAHRGWSGYFREFMFHSFLVQQGYVVLDMDYRASSGYGRDWRTAIYQQMGTPEVQDLADGVDWLVANKGVDRSRVCTYGGSYGGFLTLMALFTEPDLFACGAALRPVTDWAQYNHPYTSNILNIPELDPAAFERSSPIEFAQGLEKPLLIAHGMQDDNVFFQDSVRLVQRLIELEKENWEMAIYPVEPHGFREPSSWLDEYRRIFKLVEQTLQP